MKEPNTKEIKTKLSELESNLKTVSQRKMVSLIFLFTAILLCFAVMAKELDYLYIRKIDVGQYEQLSADDLHYELETISIDGLILYIQGWAAIPNESIEIAEVYVVLKDVNSNAHYQLKTKSMPRSDVTELLRKNKSSKFNYDRAAFYATGEITFLKRGATYQICLIYRHNKHNGHNYFIEFPDIISLGY